MAAGKRAPLGKGKKQKRAASKKRLTVKLKKSPVRKTSKKKAAEEKSPYFHKEFQPGRSFGCILGYTAPSKYRDGDKGGGAV
jgi:hypothetical protein